MLQPQKPATILSAIVLLSSPHRELGISPRTSRPPTPYGLYGSSAGVPTNLSLPLARHRSAIQDLSTTERGTYRTYIRALSPTSSSLMRLERDTQPLPTLALEEDIPISIPVLL